MGTHVYSIQQVPLRMPYSTRNVVRNKKESNPTIIEISRLKIIDKSGGERAGPPLYWFFKTQMWGWKEYTGWRLGDTF